MTLGHKYRNPYVPYQRTTNQYDLSKDGVKVLDTQET